MFECRNDDLNDLVKILCSESQTPFIDFSRLFFSDPEASQVAFRIGFLRLDHTMKRTDEIMKTRVCMCSMLILHMY